MFPTRAGVTSVGNEQFGSIGLALAMRIGSASASDVRVLHTLAAFLAITSALPFAAY